VSTAWADKRRSRLRRFLDIIAPDTHPACPICGRVYYIKTMPLHLSSHHPDDPAVIAWREQRESK
jgi:hypothetical protein